MLGLVVLALFASFIGNHAQYAGSPCTNANLTPWPVPGNSYNYFTCVNGITVEMTCPGGNVFDANPNSNVFGCVPPSVANGYYPNGNYPNGYYPNNNYPGGYYPSYSNGYYPNSYYPNNNYPNGYYPNGYYPNGNYPNGYYPNGNYPNGYYPNNYYPNNVDSAIYPYNPSIILAAKKSKK